MATSEDFVRYIVDQSGLIGSLSYRKMFGEYALYLDGKVVAFACDDSLFIKPSSASRALVPDVDQRPLFPGSKDYPVVDELLDDPDALKELFTTTAAALPPPKARPKRNK